MVKDVEIIVIEPSDKDFLTGIPSRSCVERKLKQDLEKDASGTYSIILFDIDYFKHINDEFGHNQ
jgi:diguanylate cyclase (GGDEF)-like protein